MPLSEAIQRRPAASTRRAFRLAADLPPEPTRIELVAAARRARLARACVHPWDARIESSMTAVLAYLYRRARCERWAGAHGSARFACSLRQLVVGLAPIMGWKGTPDQLVRAHRTSVQRWLDWLTDAGLITHTPQRDDDGWWWRTIILLRPLPPIDDELLAVVRVRMRSWTRREARRRARGRRSRHGCRLRDLSLLLGRSRLSRAERRRRAHMRRSALADYAERVRVRALLHQQLSSNQTHLGHPFGASATPRTTLESAIDQKPDLEHNRARAHGYLRPRRPQRHRQKAAPRGKRASGYELV